MKPTQAGSVSVFFVLIAAILIVVTFWFTTQQKTNNPTSKISLTNELKLKTQVDSAGFEFKYPADQLELMEETEEEYFKRVSADFRKNFSGYVGYEPPKFIKSLYLKYIKSDNTNPQFNDNPLAIWVFENPENLSIAFWYKNYWYYPFVWGLFDSAAKSKIEPLSESTISGKLAKSITITYQPGSPKFIYIPFKDKMMLIKIIGEHSLINTLNFD